MATISNEHGHWKRVSEDEFGNSCNVHCDSSEEVECAGDGGEGSCARPLKLRRQKTMEEKGMRKPSRPRSVGLPNVEISGGLNHEGLYLPRHLARSPFGADGWKKSRSY